MNDNKKHPLNKYDYRVTFSTLGILKVIGILAALFLVFYLRDVFGLLFIAIVLASALDPLIDRLHRYHQKSCPDSAWISQKPLYQIICCYQLVSSS